MSNIVRIALLAVVAARPRALPAQEPTDEQIAFFENNIRPLLERHCLKCHGAKKQESDLRLDSRAMLLNGGESGSAISINKPAKSLLIQAVRHQGDLKMPPKRKLDPREIAALVKWVKLGAPWPKTADDDAPVAKVRGGPITDAQRALWSLQPIADPAPPKVKDVKWPRSDVDPLPSSERGSGRRQLADWFTRRDNPLTARVMVNRIWQQHFGHGLVRTENDFRTRGDRPTHPHLLDWLASRFIESGWSVKAMHRRIMLSAVYRLSSRHDPRSALADPEAKLLWRFNRRWLSAEEIRDAILLLGGNLDTSMGGPHPFPAVKSWGFTQHNPFRAIYPTNRRSVYLMTPRLARHPFLRLFDGADPNASTANRTLTTVPTQSLFLMKNPLIHEQSKSFARRLRSLTGDEAGRVAAAFRWALSREPTDGERQRTRTFLKKYRERLQTAGVTVEKQDEAALAGFARTLLLRNEFLFVD